MIPMIVRLAFRKPDGSTWRLWLPLFLVWLLLLPIALLIAPFVAIVCLIVLVNPFRVFVVGWEILAAFRGTKIEIQDVNQFIDIDIL